MGMQILVPLGKENIVLYSEIVGAIVDLAINYILILSMHLPVLQLEHWLQKLQFDCAVYLS